MRAFDVRAFTYTSFILVLWGVSTSYPLPDFKFYYRRRTFSGIFEECDWGDKT
jgi:hypothetical protein